MQSRRWIPWLLVITTCVAAGCIGSPDIPETPPSDEVPPPPAPEVAAKFVETYDSMQDFSATVTTVSDRGTFLQEVWFKKPDRFCVHYLDERSTDSGRPTTTGDLVVFDGETQWRYVNATGNVLYASAQSLNYTFADESETGGALDALDLTRDLLARYECTLSGVKTEDGRTIYTLEVVNDTQMAEAPVLGWYPVYAVRAGIEKDSWILRSTEFLNATGKPVMTVEYRNVTQNTGIPENMFRYSPPEGAVVKPMRTVVITPPIVP